MATIINNTEPRTREVREVREDSSAGIILGVIIAILLIVLFFVYGWPAITGTPTAPAPNNVNVEVPPANIDVNLTPSSGTGGTMNGNGATQGQSAQ